MIGVFDSGKGGLCTLATAIRAGARGTYLYYADTQSAPFGNKSGKELQIIVKKIERQLKDNGCSLAVCACNTATLACAPFNLFPLPTLGVEFPIVQPPTEETLFLGTKYSTEHIPANLRSPKLIPLALESLATLADNNVEEKEIADYLKHYLSPFSGIPCVILGCTHYGLFRQIISSILSTPKILDINQTLSKKLALVTQKEPSTKILFFESQQYLRETLEGMLYMVNTDTLENHLKNIIS